MENNKERKHSSFKQLNERMKRFEAASDFMLTEESIIIIRLDGKNFKAVTSSLEKPFDPVFSASMEETAAYLAANVQNCIYAYTQSDEITLILKQMKGQTAYFDNRVQKIASVTASMAGVSFYRTFLSIVLQYQDSIAKIKGKTDEDMQKLGLRISNLWDTLSKDTIFDARVFIVPEKEMWNAIYWRQRVNHVNAINTMAQTYLDIDPDKTPSQKDAAKMLKEKGHGPETVDRKYLFGSDIFKDENGHWVTITADEMEYDLGEDAK